LGCGVTKKVDGIAGFKNAMIGHGDRTKSGKLWNKMLAADTAPP
jgi:hypothetical protein